MTKEKDFFFSVLQSAAIQYMYWPFLELIFAVFVGFCVIQKENEKKKIVWTRRNKKEMLNDDISILCKAEREKKFNFCFYVFLFEYQLSIHIEKDSWHPL